MKKLLLALVLSALVAALYLKLNGGKHVAASSIAPAESALFVQLPDLRASSALWKQTDLHAILQEPEVRAFLEHPLSHLPKGLTLVLEDFRQANPKEAFLALSGTGKAKLLAGVSSSGESEALRALFEQMESAIKGAYPEAQTELFAHRGTAIKAHTSGSKTLVQALQGDWLLVSNDLAQMETALDRLRDGGGGLAATKLFQTAVSKMPGRSELLLFAHPKLGLPRLLAEANKASVDPQNLEQLGQIQAVVAATTFEGRSMRDTVFWFKNGASAQQEPLAHASIGLTGKDTLFYWVSSLHLDFTDKQWAFLPFLAARQAALAKQQLKLSDLNGCFGPELSAFLEWSPGKPNLVVTLGLRDKVKAKQFLEVLASETDESPAWEKQQRGGASYYLLPRKALMAQPVVALTDNFLVFGLNPAFLGKAQKDGPSLEQNPKFKSAMAAVPIATNSFSYADGPVLFERVYETIRPFLVMAAGFSQKVSEYIDVGKLPSARAISRHLGPVSHSSVETGEGVLMQSFGAVTLTQHAGILALGGAAALLPKLQEIPVPGGALGQPTPSPKGAGDAKPVEQQGDTSEKAGAGGGF